MGFDDNQYILVRHTDTDHNHIHIVASRLRLNGSTVSEWQDYKRSEQLIRDLEKKYELTPAPSSFEKERRSPTTGERRLTNRTGETSARKKLQDTIDQLTQDSPTMPDLIGQLKDQGIDVRVSLTPTGEMGISYQLNGIAFSGTHLGRAYTFKGLQRYRGVSYSEKLELEVVEQAVRSPVAQVEEQQQQAATTRHKKRALLMQQQSVILDDDNTSVFERRIIDNNDSKAKQELFDVVIGTASTLQQRRRPEDVDGDQSETKLHLEGSQAVQNHDYSQTNPDTQTQQSNQLRQPITQAQNQESDTQLEDEEVDVAKCVYWRSRKAQRQSRSQSNQVAGQSILYEAESMPTPQSEQMPQISEKQPAEGVRNNQALVLPNRNENNWQAVQEYLVGDRLLSKQIVELLHAKGWIYADDEGQTIFVGRTLDGEPTGAFVLNDNTFSSIRLDPDEPATPNEEDTTLTGCFWVATFIPIQRAVLTSDPVEVLSVMALDPDFNQTPTLYLAVDSGKAIPKEFLEKLPTVVVGLKGDEEGDVVSEEILAALPQAKRINPGIAGWNKILTDEREDIKSEVQKLHKKQTGNQGLDID